MATLKKALVAIAVACAVAGTSNLVRAHCGSCGVGEAHPHDHTHEKDVCVRCEHAKTCEVCAAGGDNCTDPARYAKCTCHKVQDDEDSDTNDYSYPE